LFSDKKTKKNFPKWATDIIFKWVYDHAHNPYPTAEQKSNLVKETKLTLDELNGWFMNNRRRLKVQEIIKSAGYDPKVVLKMKKKIIKTITGMNCGAHDKKEMTQQNQNRNLIGKTRKPKRKIEHTDTHELNYYTPGPSKRTKKFKVNDQRVYQYLPIFGEKYDLTLEEKRHYWKCIQKLEEMFTLECRRPKMKPNQVMCSRQTYKEIISFKSLIK
jgi:hypothetical protein